MTLFWALLQHDIIGNSFILLLANFVLRHDPEHPYSICYATCPKGCVLFCFQKEIKLKWWYRFQCRVITVIRLIVESSASMAFVFKRNLALTVFSHAILKLKCSFFVAIRFCVAQTFFEHSRLYFQPAHSSDSKFEPAKLFFYGYGKQIRLLCGSTRPWSSFANVF